MKTCLLWSPNTSDITSTTKVYEDSNPCLQHSFFRHQSARGRLVFEDVNIYVRFNGFCSCNDTGSIQECEYEWLTFNNACYCVSYRTFLSWKCRDSIQRSARMCPDSLITFTNAFYGCEHSITDEHEQTPSDLQLTVCRDIMKCCRTNYLSIHSKIQHISRCFNGTNRIHPPKQERSCYVIGRVRYRNDRDRGCPHIFLFLNNLVLKVDIYCSVQRCGSCTCVNKTRVEVMTCVFWCSYTFIFVDSSETCLNTVYEIIKMLCLVNITTYRWYILIVNAMLSDGDGVRPGRGRTANRQNGVVVFLCLWSRSFNSALTKPS